MNLLLPLILLILILFNGYFVGVEFAIATLSRIRFEPGGDDSNKLKSWWEEADTRRQYLAASKLGIALCALGLGASGWLLLDRAVFPWIDQMIMPTQAYSLLKGTAVIALAFLLTGLNWIVAEVISQRIVMPAVERFFNSVTPFMRFFVGLTRPLVWIINQVTKGMQLIPIGYSANIMAEQQQITNIPPLDEMLNAPEQEMLTAVMDFSNLVVRQVSVPRTEVVAVEAGKPALELIRVFIENGLTKIPVFENDLDHIIGIVHLRDLVVDLENNSLERKTARDIAREGLFVPETIAVTELLRQFRDRRMHIAIVLDEFGGTAGLVTLEDLLEEIIGDVQDEFEEEGAEIEMLEDGSAIIDGMTFIEDVNQYFGLSLHEPDYDTIAGYILGKLGRIPQVGDVVIERDQQVQLRVDQMDRHRISQIILKRL